MGNDVGYEVGFRELEHAVGTLEGGDLGLDASLRTYERGVQLLIYLNGLLDGAERTVALLRGDGASGTLDAVPFDAAATAQTPTAMPLEVDDLPY